MRTLIWVGLVTLTVAGCAAAPVATAAGPRPGSSPAAAGRRSRGGRPPHDFRPGSSTVTFYDRAGAVITAYPKGPCRQFR